eukprot:PhM_4_TR17002/c2_g1_i1/m.45079
MNDSITALFPISAASLASACDYCGRVSGIGAPQSTADAELDVTFLLPSAPTTLALHLRAMGASCPPTSPENDQRLARSLTFIHNLLLEAHKSGRGEASFFDDDVRVNVAEISGALPLIKAAGWSLDDGTFTLRFHRSPSDPPCQRQLLCIDMIETEVALLERAGRGRRRAATQPLDLELPHVLEEFDLLRQLWESRENVPSLDVLHRWVYLWSFFKLLVLSMGDVDDDNEEEHGSLRATYLRYMAVSRAHALHQLDRVRAVQDSVYVSLPEPTTLMDCRNNSASTTPARPSHHNNSKMSPCSIASSVSPMRVFDSPADALVRTPPRALGFEREEFVVAQPPMSDLLRDPATTRAGLLNLRQYCFMNALLQAYYLHADVARLVLVETPSRKEVSQSGDGDGDANVRLLYRLQSLFAYMETSRVSCINPRYVLEGVAELHPDFKDGGQHDPHEFATCTLEMASEGLRKLRPCLGDDVRRLLHGKCVEHSVGWDGEPSGAERETDVLHSLPLYFDSKTATTKETHVDPMNMATTATTTTTHSLTLASLLVDSLFEEKDRSCAIQGVAKRYRSLPRLVMMTLPSRAVAAAGVAKDTTRVSFPLRLDLGALLTCETYTRACAVHRALAQNVVPHAEACVAATRALLNGHEHSAEHRFMLECVLRGAEERLEKATAECEAAGRAREHARQALEAVLESSSSSSTSNNVYRLHGVVLHLGSHNDLGHYVSYVKTSSSSKTWLRFNDTSVVEVPEAEAVMSAQTQENVYCVMYTAERDTPERTHPLPIPEYLEGVIAHEDGRKYERIAKRLSLLTTTTTTTL